MKILGNHLVGNKIKYYLRYSYSHQVTVMLLHWHNRENWARAIHIKKVEKWKFWFVKILIRNQVFHKKSLSQHIIMIIAFAKNAQIL